MKSRKELEFSEPMEPYRKKIDELDSKILTLLGKRMDIMREVAYFKQSNNIDAVLSDRIKMVKDHVRKLAAQNNLCHHMIEKIYDIMIKESCETEQAIIDKINLGEE